MVPSVDIGEYWEKERGEMSEFPPWIPDIKYPTYMTPPSHKKQKWGKWRGSSVVDGRKRECYSIPTCRVVQLHNWSLGQLQEIFKLGWKKCIGGKEEQVLPRTIEIISNIQMEHKIKRITRRGVHWTNNTVVGRKIKFFSRTLIFMHNSQI